MTAAACRNIAASFLVAVLTLAGNAAAQVNRQQDEASRPKDGFVAVNGITLHYVDWGGRGETLLFLTSLGGNVSAFELLAPKFTDHFHVLALTRRGQGQSDKPASGYDTDTLARDIAGFLDAMRIERVNLAGYSIGGAEMTRFAGTYPTRVAKLVYLDAALDFVQHHKIELAAHLPPPTDAHQAAILLGASASHPAYAKVTAPALAFSIVYDHPIPVTPQDDAAYKRYLQLLYETDFTGEQVKLFRKEMKGGQIVLLHNAVHWTFLNDPMQLSIVVPAMRKFLLTD